MTKSFWAIDLEEDRVVVERLLRQRHEPLYSLLEASIEAADPLDTVYPENPGEYAEVVWESIVLAEGIDSDLATISERDLCRVVEEGLLRCFGSDVYDLEPGAGAATERAVADFIKRRKRLR
ncbi:hypothetical protein AB0L40_04935 [Patulibacter sp. NPDC049589]|uniref:hypothetical protein n=1 Tax=Patulibacter sp. NPDC049589 TaxID=3154731 RepID=UPI0034419EA8